MENKNINSIKNADYNAKRTRYSVIGAFVGILCNLLLSSVKFMIGIFIGSIAVIGDAINNLLDLLSSFAVYIGARLANRPADKEHPFGHQRIEYVSALFIVVFIFFIAFQLLYNSILEIINPTDIKFSYIAIIILGVSIIVKIFLTLFYKYLGKKIDSLSLMAASKDSRNDVLTTLVILIGLLVNIFYEVNLDGYLGILVAIFIFISTYQMFKETMNPLIGEQSNPKFTDSIINKIKSYQGILGVKDVVIHKYGPSKYFVTARVEVDGNVCIYQLHDLVDTIESEVGESFGISIVLHMDPIDVSNKDLIEIKKQVQAIFESIDADLVASDFKIYENNEEKIVVFKALLPLDLSLTNEDIEVEINSKVKGDYQLKIIFKSDL